MDKPIIISFRWTAAEMLLANRLSMRYSGQAGKPRRTFFGGAILLLIIGGASVARHELFFALLCFPLAAVFLAMPLFIRRALLKAYAQRPDRDMLVTYEVSPDHITSRTELGSTELLWRAITQVQRIPAGFLLYLSDKRSHWLPAHGFQAPADLERLAQLAKANVPKYDQAP